MTGHGCILANSTLDCDHFGLRRNRRTLKLELIPMDAATPYFWSGKGSVGHHVYAATAVRWAETGVNWANRGA